MVSVCRQRSRKTTSSFCVVVIFLCICVDVTYEQSSCPFNQFRCSDGSGCLTTEKLCNKQKECKNAEDELRQFCSRATLSEECKSGEFRCRFGGCVDNSQKCDGRFDCFGGTDESSDICPSSSKTQTVTKPRPLPPPRLTTTTTEYIPVYKPRTTTTTTTRAPVVSSERGKCPPIDLDVGQSVVCYKGRRSIEVDCLNDNSPDGVVAEVSCKEYYLPPATGSKKLTRNCQKGTWSDLRRNFWCQLDCGDGGYKPVGFVAGGRESVKGKWPWHSGIYELDAQTKKYRNICGATLIARRAIITAAHCVTTSQKNQPKPTDILKVYLGKFYRTSTNNDEYVQEFNVEKIIVHPNYQFNNLESDVAIVWLDREAEITPIVRPKNYDDIDMSQPEPDEEVPVNSYGMLAGWGSIGNRKYPELLHEVSLPVVSHAKCREDHQALRALVRSTTFCAGYRNENKSACDGDSGGGLVFPHPYTQNKWIIQGIVSGGVPKSGGQGCDATHYVAFTNVAKFRKWSDKVIDSLIDY